MSEERRISSPDAREQQETWMDGYRAALADAVEVVDSLGGPSFANLSAPVLLRMKARLIELQAEAAGEAKAA